MFEQVLDCITSAPVDVGSPAAVDGSSAPVDVGSPATVDCSSSTPVDGEGDAL